MNKLLGQALIYTFSNGAEGGNPSFVVATSGTSPDLQLECMVEAKKRSCEVTHIHFSEESAKVYLRFYVASGPISFCGHGSLAAAAWAARASKAQDKLVLDYGIEEITLLIEDEGQRIGFIEEAGQTHEFIVDEEYLRSIRALLGLPHLQLDEFTIWTGGRQRAKALIRLARRELIQNIKIDPIERDHFCQQLGVTGIYPYVQLAKGRIAARHFPLNSGLNEDVATGNIASTVAQLVAGSFNQKVIIEQGGFHCQEARLYVQPQNIRWFVSGFCRFIN